MELKPQQLLVLNQLTDSMFPSGGFVHSSGLESCVQAGSLQTIEALESLLTTRLLFDWASQDMVALHCAMSAYNDDDMVAIKALDEQLTAMKVAKEARVASSRIGRQTLRTILLMLPDPFLLSYQEQIRDKVCIGHQPIVFGLIAAAVALQAEPALTAYAYSQVSSQVSVALKLMRFGQTQAQQLLWHIQPTISEAVHKALALTSSDMHAFAPAMEIHSMKHEYLFRRLFNS